jgi:hypothetical protein
LVLADKLVKLTIINIKTEAAIRLLDKQDGGGERRLAGFYKPLF